MRENNMEELLSGNEAIARGAYEAGVTLAAGYPGTPSTEIMESLAAFKDTIYCEWSPNEKVAFEVAAGASLCGARVVVTMKHVGLNVAADPLMNLATIGVEGGFLLCVSDDPGCHSSQNEQDSRHYARFAKIPVLEPSDSQDAKEFVIEGLRISEKYRTPVILRSTTRVSHSRSLVTLGERREPERRIEFIKDPPRHVPLPAWGKRMREDILKRVADLAAEAAGSSLNRIELRDTSLGIVANSISYQYVREVFPDASILKISWGYPFPDELFRSFAAKVEKLLVVEEVENFLEEHIRSLGIPCEGSSWIPRIGELNPTRLRRLNEQREGRGVSEPVADGLAADLPARPPVLCPGCPHRGLFYALTRHDVVVTGDIGCYSLGVIPPLDRMDTILCMGAGISMAHGMDKAHEPRKVVGVVGDSTFFHSGITGLLDIAYNRGASTIVVLDNRTTAMTGHQDHPGTGRTLMGETTREASIAEIARACGIEHTVTVNPYNLKETQAAVKGGLECKEPSLIITRAPCPLQEKKRHGPPPRVDGERCVKCGLCLKLGCPALENHDGIAHINPLLCTGCGLCAQVCKRGAIQCTTGGEGGE